MLLKNLKLKNMTLAMTEGVSLEVTEDGIVNAERIEDIKALRFVGFVDVEGVEMVRQDMRVPEMPAVKTFKRRKK
jgi:hypothetical protein